MPKSFVAISNYGSMIGGGEYSFLDIMEGLAKFYLPIAVLPEDGVMAERLKNNFIPVQVIPLPKIRPWYMTAICRNLALLCRACTQHEAALIYANGSKPALYGGLVGRMTGIPTIWHCRVADRDPKLDGILFRLVTQIVANSQATGRRFRDHGQNKVSIVHNGVNLKWFQDLSVRLPALADGSRQIILVVARLSRWKRHDIILSAFEQIGAAHPSAHLVFIGPSDPDERSWSDQLMALAGKSPFHERIHWMGAVDDPRPWYHAATLVLLASQGEPFGRVLVEAMACGLPVVATRAGGVPEIVRDGIDGLLVPTGNSDVLSAAVIKLLSENELRYKMGANGRERSKAFSIERHVHLMRELFDALICSPIENNR